MKYLFLSAVLFVTNIGFCNTTFAEEYKNSDFIIYIPETWKAIERDIDGKSRSWLFGKQATEKESGVSIAVSIIDLNDPSFTSESDLILTQDRWLNRDVFIMGKSKQVLNTSVIYDEIIDGKNFRAVNFRSLFNVHNHPELELEIFGRAYLAIIDSKVIRVNFQASKSHENMMKPELEKIIETIKLF